MFKKYKDEDIFNYANPLLSSDKTGTALTFDMNNKDMKNSYDKYMEQVKYR